jgi:hypothetical protein
VNPAATGETPALVVINENNIPVRAVVTGPTVTDPEVAPPSNVADASTGDVVARPKYSEITTWQVLPEVLPTVTLFPPALIPGATYTYAPKFVELLAAKV